MWGCVVLVLVCFVGVVVSGVKLSASAPPSPGWFCLLMMFQGALMILICDACARPNKDGIVHLGGKTYRCIEVKEVKSWEPVKQPEEAKP